MKLYQKKNIIVSREVYGRFEDLVIGHEVNEEGEPVKFLGKFIVPSNYSEEEVIGLYRKEG